jgi:predicted hotdog family 3-hydroxylacyl-ACP dehydratase
VEYAAQAMALHGNLLDRPDIATAVEDGSAGAVFRPPRLGYLASVRDLKFSIDDLSRVPDDLRIRAQRLSGDDRGFIYEFEIHGGGRSLMTGRVAAHVFSPSVDA